MPDYLLIPSPAGVLAIPTDAGPDPDPDPILDPPAGATWSIGFGEGLYTDSGKTTAATTDGQLIHTADDSIGAHDLVQSTAGSRPILDLYAFEGFPSILCQPWRSAKLIPGASPAPINPQSCTIGVVFRPMAPASYDPTATVVGYGVSDGGAGYFWENDSYPLPFWSMTSNSGGQSAQTPPVTPGPIALVLIGTPDSFVARINGVQVLTAVAAGTTSVSGISLGGYLPAGSASYAAFLGAIGYPSALAGDDLDALESYLMQFESGTGFPPTAPAILALGDSLTIGVASVTAESATWPQVMLDSLEGGAALKRGFANLAVGGTRAEDWLANGAAWVDPYYDAARPDNILFYWIGANSMGSGTRAEVMSFCEARKAVGWTVVLMDVIAGWDNPTIETARQTYNAAVTADFPTSAATRIRSGASYADYLVQLGSDPNIGAPGAELNTTYFSTDKVHLKDAGLAIVAGYATAVMGLLGYPSA